ncbi:hypothetical protein ACJX0J_023095 [Zea mays]
MGDLFRFIWFGAVDPISGVLMMDTIWHGHRLCCYFTLEIVRDPDWRLPSGVGIGSCYGNVKKNKVPEYSNSTLQKAQFTMQNVLDTRKVYLMLNNHILIHDDGIILIPKVNRVRLYLEPIYDFLVHAQSYLCLKKEALCVWIVQRLALATIEMGLTLMVSPGAWLSDLSHERYEVREKKSSKKKEVHFANGFLDLTLAGGKNLCKTYGDHSAVSFIFMPKAKKCLLTIIIYHTNYINRIIAGQKTCLQRMK